jgi:hypothetical protein
LGPWYFALLLATPTGNNWAFAHNHPQMTKEGCIVALDARDGGLRASAMIEFAALEPTLLATECLTKLEIEERNKGLK